LRISGARCWGSSETVVRGSLVGREKPEPLQASFDRAQRPAVFPRNIGQRIAGLESRHESTLLVSRPRLPNIIRQLRSPLRACGNLLEGRDAREQGAQHIRPLQHRPGLELRACRWIHSLNESLQYFPCTLFLHDQTIHGY
jgi:hypothetical protein